MNHQELYKLLVTVQKNVRCPQCGKQYTFPMIQIRGIVDSVIFLELNCTNHMPLLATISLNKPVPRNQKTKERVTNNDVIDVYRFLKDFSGNFEETFKEIKKK